MYIQFISGAHILYIGPRGVGRKTTVQLSAAVVNAKVYNISSQRKEVERSVEAKGEGAAEEEEVSVIREACKAAALDGKRIVVLVEGSLLQWHHKLWTILLELMRNGKIMIHVHVGLLEPCFNCKLNCFSFCSEKIS